MPLSSSVELTRLLQPMELHVFCRDYWERRPCMVARQSPSYYSSLLSIADVDSLIMSTSHAASPSKVRLVKSQEDGVVSRPVPHTGDGTPDSYCLYRSYGEEGYTITVDRLDLRWKPVAALCRNLEDVFHYPVVANLYLTPRRAQGFLAHFDTHDVFVLQLEGSKTWYLYHSALELPLGDTISPSFPRSGMEPPQQVVTLKAGDLLYIPRGYIHEAMTSEESSLHLTVGIHVFRWADLVVEAVALVAQGDRRFREALPIGFIRGACSESAPLRERLRELFEVLAAQADSDKAVGRLAQRLLSNGQPLPDGHFVSLDRLSTLSLNSRVARRTGMTCRITVDDDGVRIHYPGNIIVGPRAIEPALRFVAASEEFAVSDVPNCLGDEDKKLLIGRLVREGLLAIKEQPDG